jgi:hypothetical protein
MQGSQPDGSNPVLRNYLYWNYIYIYIWNKCLHLKHGCDKLRSFSVWRSNKSTGYASFINMNDEGQSWSYHQLSSFTFTRNGSSVPHWSKFLHCQNITWAFRCVCYKLRPRTWNVTNFHWKQGSPARCPKAHKSVFRKTLKMTQTHNHRTDSVPQPIKHKPMTKKTGILMCHNVHLNFLKLWHLKNWSSWPISYVKVR